MWSRMSNRARWWTVIAGVFLALYVATGWVYGMPRYVWYQVRAELEVDGKPVTVKGTIKCSRTFDNVLRNSLYPASSRILAKRLDDGGAILIADLYFCGRFIRTGSLNRTIDNPPLVLWLDDFNDPQVAEYYELPSYQDAKNARVHVNFIGIDWYMRSPVALPFISVLLGTGSVVDGETVLDTVPWLRVPFASQEKVLVGFRATVLGPEILAAYPSLQEALSEFSEPTELTFDQFRELNDSGRVWNRYINQRSSCAVLNDPTPETRSSWIRHTYGLIPSLDPFGAVYSEASRTPGFIRFERYPYHFNKSDMLSIDMDRVKISISKKILRSLFYIPSEKTLYYYKSIEIPAQLCFQFPSLSKSESIGTYWHDR
ncbi:hypothetical protein [Microbaculum sp. FT89]|uniref:hypothetical protein n=1 Tax=Microbaculum sp. FT89 TaxID=3447298 RepID=UPI003F53753F